MSRLAALRRRSYPRKRGPALSRALFVRTVRVHTHGMRHVTTIATAAVAILIAQVLLAQTTMKPTAPGTPGDPAW